MKTTLTIIAALVFTIQILVNISDIFTTPPAGAIDIFTIPPEERPDEGTFYIPIDIEFTVLSIVFFAGGLCLSIAVLLPDKKPKSASLDISEQAQNITALEEKLAIIALVGFSLNLLYILYYEYFHLFKPLGADIYDVFIKYDAFTDSLKFWVEYTFTIEFPNRMHGYIHLHLLATQ